MLNLNAFFCLFYKISNAKVFSLRLLFLSLSLILTLTAFSQVCDPQAADDCEDAPVLCSLKELNGYSCRNPPPPVISGPTPLCPIGGIPNNMSWWAFVAGSKTTTLKITASNCTYVGGNMGVQAGIWTDCTYTTPVFCQAACWVGTQTLSGYTLPCQTYFVFIDGCGGSQCDYTIEVIHGWIPPGLNYPPILTGPDTGCVGETLCFNADVEGACCPDYSWTIDGAPVGGILGTLCDTFTEPGTFEVCIKAFVGHGLTICDEAGPVCQTVVIQNLPPEEKQSETLCYEDRHGLYFEECSTPVPDTPGVHRICCERTKPNGCVFEVCKEYRIKPQSQQMYYLRVFCEEDSVTLPSGEVVTECGEYIDFQANGGPLGCDTTVKVFISVLKPEVSFTMPYCTGDLICLNAVTTFPCADTTPAYTEFWTSKETGDTLARDTSLLCVELPGEYCYLVQPLDLELICSTAQYCFEIPEKFNAEIIVPEVVCNTDTIRTEAVANLEGIDSSSWTVEGGTITQTEGDSVIYWIADTGIAEVEICYEELLNGCSKSSNCRLVQLHTTRDHFEWEQVGNELCFFYPQEKGAQVTWNIDGRTYVGDSVCVSFQRTRDIEAVVRVDNACGVLTIEQHVRFDWKKSKAKLYDKGNMGITMQLFNGTILLKRSQTPYQSLSIEVLDIRGKIVFNRNTEWPRGMVELNVDDFRPIPGLYFIVVTDLTTRNRTIRSVFWSE